VLTAKVPEQLPDELMEGLGGKLRRSLAGGEAA
jgi:hypothetical protein